MLKLEDYSELPSIQGIYFITNIINQKYYLGRAVNIKGRYSWKDIEYSHHNYLLRNAILKYGRENFIISITEYQNITLGELIEIEQGLLDKHYGNGLCYNLSKFATCGSEAGENHPTSGKIKINNGIEEKFISPGEEIPEGFIIGRKPFSEETLRKQSEAKKGENNPNYGKSIYNNGIEERYFSPEEEIPEGYIWGVKEETLKKRSEALKGENNPNYGKKRYNNGVEERFISLDEKIPEGFIIGVKEETKRKQSEANKGENNPMFGQKHSEETCKKQSEAKKSINSKKKIRVITPLCCYFSMTDAQKELGICNNKFYKLFEKDLLTGFFVEKI